MMTVAKGSRWPAVLARNEEGHVLRSRNPKKPNAQRLLQFDAERNTLIATFFAAGTFVPSDCHAVLRRKSPALSMNHGLIPPKNRRSYRAHRQERQSTGFDFLSNLHARKQHVEIEI